LAIVDGNPAFSYWDIAEGTLKYIRSSSSVGTSASDWSKAVTLASSGLAYNSSLAVVEGLPAIAYKDNRNSDLHYIRSNSKHGASVNEWGKPITIASQGQAGYEATLMVVAGHPAISYVDNGTLCYVRSTTSTGASHKDWLNVIRLGEGRDSGSCDSSLAIVAGKPALSHLTGDYPEFTLQYTYSSTASGGEAEDWTTVDLDSGSYYETYLADVGGSPAIVLREAFSSFGHKYNNRILYFHAATSEVHLPGWKSVTVVGSEAIPLGLMSRNDAPLILCVRDYRPFGIFSRPRSELAFLQATDATGTAWDAAQTLHNNGGSYTVSELLIDNRLSLAFAEQSKGVNVHFISEL
ncbi:MAG: hypothetical protein M3R04_03610, partial [bacterium]|nr:hypothetical protein [bacterium]